MNVIADKRFYALEQIIELIDHNWSHFYIDSYGLWINNAWSGPNKHFEIHYYVQGSNSLQLDNQVLQVKEGDFILQSDIIQNSSCADGQFKMYYLSFLFKNDMLNQQMRRLLSDYQLENSPFFVPSFDQDLNSFITEHRIHQHFLLFAKHLFIHLLIKVHQSLRLLHNRNSKNEQIVQQIMKDIQDNYSSKIHLADIAKPYNIHERYLNQIFRKITGTPLNKYITKTRMEHAKRLLLTTEKSITEIALDTGFYDAAHFCKTFKQVVELSPKQYKSKFDQE